MKTESNVINNRPDLSSRRRAAIAGLVLPPCIALLALHYLLPREYFAKVTLEVKQDNTRAIGDVFGGNARAGNAPMFVPTQFEVLRTKSVLYPVIENLDLVNKWSKEGTRLQKETAYQKLSRMLELKSVHNTALIDIGVYSTHPQEAANIANTMAVVYRENRLFGLERDIDRSFDQLREEVEKQRLIVEKAGTEAARIRQEDRIIDLETESSTSALGTPERNIVELGKQLNEQRSSVRRLETQYELISKLKPEELKEVLRTLNIQDEAIAKIVSSLQEAIRQVSKLSNDGRGERHPSIASLLAEIRASQDQLAEQLKSLLENQANKVAIEKRTLAELEKQFNSSQETQIEQKERESDYVRAKNHHLQEKAIYQAAKAKLAQESLERGIDFDPANIWEKAEPPLKPAPFSFRGLWRRIVQ